MLRNEQGVTMSNVGWFGPKSIGYGISPRMWQGWVVLALYIAVLVLVALSRDIGLTARLTAIAAATGLLTVIVALTYSRAPPSDTSQNAP